MMTLSRPTSLVKAFATNNSGYIKVVSLMKNVGAAWIIGIFFLGTNIHAQVGPLNPVVKQKIDQCIATRRVAVEVTKTLSKFMELVEEKTSGTEGRLERKVIRLDAEEKFLIIDNSARWEGFHVSGKWGGTGPVTITGDRKTAVSHMDCEGYNVSDVGAGGTTCNGTFKADEKGQLQPGQLGQIVLKCVQEYGGQ